MITVLKNVTKLFTVCEDFILYEKARTAADDAMGSAWLNRCQVGQYPTSKMLWYA